MADFSLNDSLITKKIIDLLVGFLRKNSRRNRLYQQTQVTDRFSLEDVKIPAVIVKNVSNTQIRTDFTDYIAPVYGRIELVPISGDQTLVGNNLIRTNLPQTVDYDPRWPFDPTIGYPNGYSGTHGFNPAYDITAAVFTSQTGGSFNADVTTGMLITLPPPSDFDPSSIVYGLEAPFSNGSNGVIAPNPIQPTFRTINTNGLVLESQLNRSYPATGNLQVPLNLDLLPNYDPNNAVNYTLTGTNANGNVYIFSQPTTGINAVYSGNTTGSGLFPFSGVGISGAGWYQSQTSSGNFLNWTAGSFPSFSGAIAIGQVPPTGVPYGIDYNYEGPDVHTMAIALNDTQDQFYLIYSGISLAGQTVIQPVVKDQYIVNASGLVPGLTGTVFKLNDVLWAGDQYQALTFNKTIPTYAVYGGNYQMSIQFECYANSTLESQELGDLVERFLVEQKNQPYGHQAFNLTAWSQGGQGEEEYINDHIFSTTVSAEGFRFWQEYRGGDLITAVSGIALPVGFYNNSGAYIPPLVESTVLTTDPITGNPTNWNI